MTALLERITDPARWRRYAESRLEAYRRNRADDVLDRQMAALGPVKLVPGEVTIIGEGMWRNPNHFFRLRLFVQALAARGSFRLLGVLRRRADWRERRALERIGFSEFIFMDEDEEFQTEQFIVEASRMLNGVGSHRDILTLRLPEDLPAYTFYDTVLKLARHPQPPLDHPLWRATLAETLRNLAIYAREFATRRVAHVALSHAWKNEWATSFWLALRRRIPAYHLAAYSEAIRIRRFVTIDDYAKPKEHMARSDFEALPPAARDYLSETGARDLALRASGRSSDLNVRHAFDPAHRIDDRAAARIALSGQTLRPVVVVCAHLWYDFPHIFAMTNFVDFADWMLTTLDRIREIDHVFWLLKPHPIERFFGGFGLNDLVRDLPPHVRVLPTNTDSATALNAADCVVTLHGTVGLEAAAQGAAVILGDRNYFSDWNIAHVASNREDYLRLLGEAGRLPRPDAAARQRARACFALALAEPPKEVQALRTSCDAGGAPLYQQIADHFALNAAGVAREAARISAFLDQHEIHSYAAYHLVEASRAAASRRKTA